MISGPEIWPKRDTFVTVFPRGFEDTSLSVWNLAVCQSVMV